MKIIANNYEHNLPQIKVCSCGDDMKLNLKEDTKGDITYIYKCFVNVKFCGVEEVVNGDE